MLELHKIIKVSHAVSFPIVFLLFCERGRIVQSYEK